MRPFVCTCTSTIHFLLHVPVPNFWTQYFEDKWADFDVIWHEWSIRQTRKWSSLGVRTTKGCQVTRCWRYVWMPGRGIILDPIGFNRFSCYPRGSRVMGKASVCLFALCRQNGWKYFDQTWYIVTSWQRLHLHSFWRSTVMVRIMVSMGDKCNRLYRVPCGVLFTL